MREWLEYAAVWTLLKIMGALPRSVARGAAAAGVRLLLALLPKLRQTALFNLRLAFPDWNDEQRNAVLRGMARNLGRMAAEFARTPRWTRASIEDIVVLDGHEHFLAARARGRGVLILTGHLGGWELSSLAHAVYGYPLSFMARPLDNARVDALVNRYRGLAGNRPIYKNESARTMLKTLKQGGAIGILADQNTMPEEGIFVDFFGAPACTTAGVARMALHTGAAVVPGYAVWDEALGKYRLYFEPAVELVTTGEAESDVRENTQKFARVIESIIRKYPEQWVWVHARWKTRPAGDPPLYPFLR